MLDLHLSLFPHRVLPVGISTIQLIHEVLLLLLKILAHLEQSRSALLVLLHTSLDILQKVLIPCSALDLLDLNESDLVLQLLGSHGVVGALELLSLLYLLLEELPLQGQ